MLSRLALTSARAVRAPRFVGSSFTAVRYASDEGGKVKGPFVYRVLPSYPEAADLNVPTDKFPGSKESEERDLVNFPPPRMRDYPKRTQFYLIPYSWFEFFQSKTGVSGGYVFGAAFTTFLLSKEIWVIEHNFTHGVHLALLFLIVNWKYGPAIRKYILDGNYASGQEYNKLQESEMKNLQTDIENEKKAQWQAQGEKYLYDAKRENVALQLEASFRERQMNVYNEVKRRLDYQVEVQNSEARVRQQHLANWIVNQVEKSLTPEMEKQAMKQSLADLKMLATRG